MKFIIIDNHSGKHRSINANALSLGLAILGLISIPLMAGMTAYYYGLGEAGLNNELDHPPNLLI